MFVIKGELLQVKQFGAVCDPGTVDDRAPVNMATREFVSIPGSTARLDYEELKIDHRWSKVNYRLLTADIRAKFLP
ncbi:MULTISPECIES: hypothetical protein [unclassified Rhizobium]|uniref:hypothetical protein n=1 Tax=unclassified Rhizobium TaxID=2613769 RepID=UPI0006FECBD2|nr:MULTISPECIES: hypothetical protein [unclassified Rhizobium]KQV36393.1 hypothetical protein ASC86_24825 [Rhizobium sp. Root1212]KRD26443.1 hypothetical protein ASE37_24740 [Rhizobium sp. Root268]